MSRVSPDRAGVVIEAVARTARDTAENVAAAVWTLCVAADECSRTQALVLLRIALEAVWRIEPEAARAEMLTLVVSKFIDRDAFSVLRGFARQLPAEFAQQLRPLLEFPPAPAEPAGHAEARPSDPAPRMAPEPELQWRDAQVRIDQLRDALERATPEMRRALVAHALRELRAVAQRQSGGAGAGERKFRALDVARLYTLYTPFDFDMAWAPPPLADPPIPERERAAAPARRTLERPERILRALKRAPPPATRVVNTGFTNRENPATLLRRWRPLRPDSEYYFWVEVGELLHGSIETAPTPLPYDKLPPNARLTVALFAAGSGFRVEAGADTGELELRADGSAVVMRQVREPAGAPGASTRPRPRSTERLYFPVRTPEAPGTCRLRCNIYYEHNLVQSRLVQAKIGGWTPVAWRALRSTCDYSVTHALDTAYLAGLEPQALSLFINANGDEAHGLYFYGQQEFKSAASLDAGLLQDVIRMARGALRRVSWGSEEPWEKEPYRYDDRLDLVRLRDDLVRLVIRGYRIYDAIINALAGDGDAARRLEEIMSTPGLLQIALKQSARFVFPVALLYDHPIDTNAPADGYTLCPASLEALQHGTDLQDLSCFTGVCASREHATVICPSGFWGYRHTIGIPLSLGPAPDATHPLEYGSGVRFTVGVSTDRSFTMRHDHEARIKALQARLEWNYGDTRESTMSLLQSTTPHLVYFYCHGGLAGDVPYLKVGPESSRGITRDNLRAKRIRWETTRPLVFINGCHTTALEPERALDFVSAFIENACASGVIGTEITIFEPLACSFAEECLRRFFVDGAAIGTAVRGARLALLQRGNPLGLVYIPFIATSLKVAGLPTAKTPRAAASWAPLVPAAPTVPWREMAH